MFKKFDFFGRKAEAAAPERERTEVAVPRSFRRLVNSVKRTSRAPPSLRGNCKFTLLTEGWLIHYSSLDDERKRRYWRLTTRAVEIYNDKDCRNYANPPPSCAGNFGQGSFSDVDNWTIKLHDILNVEVGESASSKAPVIKLTLSQRNEVLYILEDTSTNYKSQPMSRWMSDFKAALAPHISGSLFEGSTSQVSKNSLSRQKSWSWSLFPEDQATDNLEDLYQILPDDILGSGQFGVVYLAKHRSKDLDVAIKAIDKKKFPQSQSQQLRHEVTVISGLDHPGIVKLYNMFETPRNVYVVMEKLDGDMLELILDSREGFLNEKTAKFLVYQILVALAYLHKRSIVHCDLKPENVLLFSSENGPGPSDPRPRVKLCDFGFARIIGEQSFRSSVVGTPAYLPPEVLRNEGYNRSLDMWSAGIIVYVTLSGTFPFNEEDDINEQYQNCTQEFMFPGEYWAGISGEAIDLISALLQVQRRKRLTVGKAFGMAWLNDYDLWVDLRRMERAVGNRYLTHESDDARWADYAKAHGKALIY